MISTPSLRPAALISLALFASHPEMGFASDQASASIELPNMMRANGIWPFAIKLIGAHSEARHAVVDAALAGEENNGHVLEARGGFQGAEKQESIPIRKTHVEQDRIDCVIFDGFQSIARSGGQAELVTVAEESLDHQLHVELIFDEEDLLHRDLSVRALNY